MSINGFSSKWRDNLQSVYFSTQHSVSPQHILLFSISLGLSCRTIGPLVLTVLTQCAKWNSETCCLSLPFKKYSWISDKWLKRHLVILCKLWWRSKAWLFEEWLKVFKNSGWAETTVGVRRMPQRKRASIFLRNFIYKLISILLPSKNVFVELTQDFTTMLVNEMVSLENFSPAGWRPPWSQLPNTVQSAFLWDSLWDG